MKNIQKTYNFQFNPNAKYFFSHIINSTTVLHEHSYYEIIFIIDGSLVNIVNGIKYTLNKGDFALIPIGHQHQVTPKDNCLRRDICITSDLFEGFCNFISPSFLDLLQKDKSIYQFTLSLSQQASVLQKIDILSAKHNITDSETKLLICSILTDILQQFLSKEDSTEIKATPIWFDKLMIRFQNVEYIQGGIKMLIKDLGYNEIYINRIFKKQMGMSLSGYLMKTRLHFALNYLITSNYSITDISYLLGFSSPSFFYKQFRKTYLCSPAEYRKNLAKGTLVVSNK